MGHVRNHDRIYFILEIFNFPYSHFIPVSNIAELYLRRDIVM